MWEQLQREQPLWRAGWKREAHEANDMAWSWKDQSLLAFIPKEKKKE